MIDLHIMGDIDDVFFPWAGSVHDGCRDAGLHDGSGLWKTWQMWDDYGCTKEEWLKVVDQLAADGMYENALPLPGSVESWNRLYWQLHGRAALHLVTARGTTGWTHAENIKRWTPIWVEEFGIAHDTLTFAHDKVKAQAELGVRFDYAIDDGIHNYAALDSDGVKVYLLTRPHNIDFPVERRVDSVGEFVDIVLKEEA